MSYTRSKRYDCYGYGRYFLFALTEGHVYMHNDKKRREKRIKKRNKKHNLGKEKKCNKKLHSLKREGEKKG